ncbi:MAG: response regulator transcription factor [Candidatus Binatia bacterium]
MAEKQHILVVEDEAAIRTGLCDLLAFHGHQPSGAASGEEGLALASEGQFALVLLDVMLPGLNGFDVCRALRAKRPSQAILMLTARGAEADVLEGFRCGADDYVTKPFSLAELLARVDALLRRSAAVAPPPPEPFDFGCWRVDPQARCASSPAATVALTSREVALLALFAREPGRIVSRRRLLAEIWGLRHVEGIRTRTIDMHLVKLRRKIETDPHSTIETVRGEGYRFNG